MTGAGLSSAGFSPAGTGSVTQASASTGKALSDAQGRRHGARYINPVTRMYEFDSFGRYKGMANVSQLVELAFMTERGTSALPNLGLERVSGVIGAAFAQRRQEDIRRALRFLTDSNLVEIISVKVDTSRRPVLSLVRWRDLSTYEEQEISVP